MQRMVFLMLTYSCNLNCIYCYQKHKTSQSMSLETAKRSSKMKLYWHNKLRIKKG